MKYEIGSFVKDYIGNVGMVIDHKEAGKFVTNIVRYPDTDTNYEFFDNELKLVQNKRVDFTKEFKNQYNALRSNVINCIKAYLVINKAKEIALDNTPPIVYYMDGDNEEIITNVNETGVKTTNYGDFIQSIEFENLSTGVLIEILDAIEKDDFDIVEK